MSRTIYIPVYRMAVSYLVSFGRRWSVLEHLILLELTSHKRSLAELAVLTGVPERLVVEALINLLRANWIEIRSADGVVFQATAAGARRAAEEKLPPQIQTRPRWISLCVERLTGNWLRADDLDLVYEKDLPEGAHVLEPEVHTYSHSDGRLRELFYLDRDEALEPAEPQFQSSARPYARVTVAFDEIRSGMPGDIPMSLRDALLSHAAEEDADTEVVGEVNRPDHDAEPRADISEGDFIVGGDPHKALVLEALSKAKSSVILHSCFLQPAAVRGFIPAFEAAAKRGTRVELLWGLHSDPENLAGSAVAAECQKVLDAMPLGLRKLVQLSPMSSGAHLKVLMFDRAPGVWETVVGSCNFLQTAYSSFDVSVRIRSQRLARRVLSELIEGQLPSSGGWSQIARRLHATWVAMNVGRGPETGSHGIRVLLDDDHYACIRTARDLSQRDVVIGCDLYGLAAETSVVVPMERAVELGRKVRLLYQRPSKTLIESGYTPDRDALRKRGIVLEECPGLHGKFLAWDDEAVAITSFNWLASAVDGTRPKSAELGVLLSGPDLRKNFARRIAAGTAGALDVAG